MTDLQYIRLKLSDSYRIGNDDFTADDETAQFKLTHGNIKAESVSVTVNETTKVENTDFNIDYPQGVITFQTTPPQPNDYILVRYSYSVFSDEEYQSLLDRFGNVYRVISECIEILLIDLVKRADYSTGQTNLSYSQVTKNLMDLRKEMKVMESNDTSSSAIIGDRASEYYPSQEYHDCDLSREDI